MAYGIFLIGLDTTDDVIEIRNAAINILKAGGQIVTSWNSEGTSLTKYQGMSITMILDECNAFLQLADSGSYGKRITRTTAAFNSAY